MADFVLQRSGLSASLQLHAAQSLVQTQFLPAYDRLLFRGDADAAKACGEAFGVTLPVEANRAAVSGKRSALWLGPDEWLLICPESESEAVAGDLAASLKAPHSLVDISHRQVAIEISGPHAATLLNACILLDLDDQAFPVGCCTRTIFAKAEIVLWRTEATRYHVEAWRSFADYVAGLLVEASRGMPAS